MSIEGRSLSWRAQAPAAASRRRRSWTTGFRGPRQRLFAGGGPGKLAWDGPTSGFSPGEVLENWLGMAPPAAFRQGRSWKTGLGWPPQRLFARGGPGKLAWMAPPRAFRAGFRVVISYRRSLIYVIHGIHGVPRSGEESQAGSRWCYTTYN